MPGLLWYQLLSVIKNVMYFVDEVWALCDTELSASKEQLFLECMDRIWAQAGQQQWQNGAPVYSKSLARPCDDMLCHPHQTSLAAFLGASGIADGIDHGNPNSRMYWTGMCLHGHLAYLMKPKFNDIHKTTDSNTSRKTCVDLGRPQFDWKGGMVEIHG
ncbi:hypothetical protein K438DRAFT_1748130 [Mycena galopus ATCC 62051]|nr:hypothetical protein K438DRAFT_1748130 [Mycena galopus ATCC 62051]